ncbi:MAG: NTP transferase domain-containing protein, partial [Caldilineaceae bacterium]|nr:NTP transferase domain-containing protein [Caldilineaceae bacterium]
MNTIALLLAAGYGKRMKSDLPKVLHPLVGRPMIEWCVRAVQPLVSGRPVVVVGHGKEQVQTALAGQADFVEQAEQRGTGHA